MRPEVRVSAQLTEDAAQLLADAAERGGHLVITGGSTPKAAYNRVAELGADWSRAEIWFSDERCVGPDHEHSNFRMASESLLSKIEPRAVHRMQGELGRDEGTAEYRLELTEVGAFELVLLGLGPDGHVASLFPNFPTLDVTGRDVVGSDAGYEPFVDRISLTLPRLCATDELLFLVAGEDKADAVALAFAGGPSPRTPGSRARSAEGTTRAIIDRAAASKLS